MTFPQITEEKPSFYKSFIVHITTPITQTSPIPSVYAICGGQVRALALTSHCLKR